MDFAQDSTAYGQRYQFMFGKSVLVAPVTEPDAKDRDIYLPDGAAWYDFWSGERYTGGQTVTRETPLDVIPLFVKAGSVIPFGPEVQYATEKNGITWKSGFMKAPMANLPYMRTRMIITTTRRVLIH